MACQCDITRLVGCQWCIRRSVKCTNGENKRSEINVALQNHDQLIRNGIAPQNLLIATDDVLFLTVCVALRDSFFTL